MPCAHSYSSNAATLIRSLSDLIDRFFLDAQQRIDQSNLFFVQGAFGH